jgi:hypothetical protein
METDVIDHRLSDGNDFVADRAASGPAFHALSFESSGHRFVVIVALCLRHDYTS